MTQRRSHHDPEYQDLSVVSTIRFRVENSPLGARETMRSFVQQLRLQACDIDAVGRVEIAVTEALNNVIEHACAHMPDGEIRLWSRLHRTDLVVCLRDNGRPFPNLTLPAGQPVSVDVHISDLPEGGFGWNLIRTLVKDLRYRRRGELNCLTMRIPMQA